MLSFCPELRMAQAAPQHVMAGPSASQWAPQLNLPAPGSENQHMVCQEVEATKQQAHAAQAPNAGMAQRALHVRKAVSTLQAAVLAPMPVPDAAGALRPILRALGRLEKTEERTAQLLDQFTCAMVKPVCQVSFWVWIWLQGLGNAGVWAGF